MPAAAGNEIQFSKSPPRTQLLLVLAKLGKSGDSGRHCRDVCDTRCSDRQTACPRRDFPRNRTARTPGRLPHRFQDRLQETAALRQNEGDHNLVFWDFHDTAVSCAQYHGRSSGQPDLWRKLIRIIGSASPLPAGAASLGWKEDRPARPFRPLPNENSTILSRGSSLVKQRHSQRAYSIAKNRLRISRAVAIS